MCLKSFCETRTHQLVIHKETHFHKLVPLLQPMVNCAKKSKIKYLTIKTQNTKDNKNGSLGNIILFDSEHKSQ